jgi:hypothetical protein
LRRLGDGDKLAGDSACGDAMRRPLLTLLTATIPIVIGADAPAQVRVRTETVRPHSSIPEKDLDPPPGAKGPALKLLVAPPPEAPAPEPTRPDIVAEAARLPPQVARTRDRILAAARTGRLDALLAVMQASDAMPIFSLGADKDPLLYWRSNFPDSGGVEILATLIGVLESGSVHVDAGTPQDLYLWPYFARVPLKELTPAQKVELFRLVTGADYKSMLDAGAYNFYRVGIGSDGSWRFFVAGD